MERRNEVIEAAVGGEHSFTKLRQRVGISRKNGYKWLNRYRDAPALTGFFTRASGFSTSRGLGRPYNERMATAPLIDRREHVIDHLSSGYANGQLELDDLERRLALVHAAETTAELDAIVTDLVPVAPAALVPLQRLRVVMSSVDRRGPWSVPPQLATRVFCGNLVLDLREARLAATGTTIEVNVTMGNVEVIVPPDLGVEVDASSVLGNIEDRSSSVAPRTTVRIVGRVTLGNLEIATLGRGETRREARRRWRRALPAPRH